MLLFSSLPSVVIIGWKPLRRDGESSPRHTSLACQALPAAGVSWWPWAPTQQGRQSLWILKSSVFLPCLQFPYLGSQCSSPATSSYPACHKEDTALSICRFTLSILSNSSDHTQNPVPTRKEPFRSSGAGKEWDGMLVASSVSHVAFGIPLFLCKLKTQGDQALEPTDKACAHSIFYNSYTTKYFARPKEVDIKGIIWSAPVSLPAKGSRMKYRSHCRGTGRSFTALRYTWRLLETNQMSNLYQVFYKGIGWN